ncbi:type II toxin-antitoxin system Phd/YefM family antitoxin [Mycolicibacterium sphagni]|uniref:Type II toxin-antitoxin system prevent-host-death family antitoxin n=1 Tax=Mycolicibacterium sphagni TaxID=1786 RepID=A0ABX2JR06_9MYCO|nr:type II toxin-antitoxin system prevent-host-death family antitoxin [Mycolicibacterium sphagni]NTY60128.1 type II toxin-antitoxin system prevent-host-death family antitoxin [Mycolicibacterium sphagni]
MAVALDLYCAYNVRQMSDKERAMATTTVSVRELVRNSATVLNAIRPDEPVVLTRNGRPIAALVAIDPDQVDALILSTVPEFEESRNRAATASAEGRTVPVQQHLSTFSREDLIAAGATPEELAEAGFEAQALAGADSEPARADARPSQVDEAIAEVFSRIDKAIHVHGQALTRAVLQRLTDTESLASLKARAGLKPQIEAASERLIGVRVRTGLAQQLAQGTTGPSNSPGGTELTFGGAVSYAGSIIERNVELSTHDGLVDLGILEARLDASVSAVEQSVAQILER